MHRRALLKGIAATSGAMLLSGCAPKKVQTASAAPPLVTRERLAKVLVSPDREIRTIAGLRPFRPSGFRVVAEKLGEKLCVHNYGHGGAGITLSWGTANLAAQMVRDSGARQVAVIGCGVVGLATARLLQQMGIDVTIYATALPPDTTSNVAGGLWEPFSVFDADQTTTAFQQQFNDAVQFSYRYFQGFAGEDYGVRWMPTYVLSPRPFQAGSAADVSSALRAFHPELRDLAPGEHAFPVPHARRFHAMLIEPHPYLRALIRDFRLAGGRIIVREFREVGELTTLPEPVVVNCTGLGARQLFGDEQLIPIKGQLTFLLPQPEVNYVVIGDGLYMFPRRDGILLGGTFVRNDWTLEPDPAAKDRILNGHADLFRNL